MENDRNNRNDDRSRDNWNDESRNRGYGENRSSGNRENYGADFSRGSSRSDRGGGNFYGSSRDDYGARSGAGIGGDRGYNAGQSGGGYDEWSRRGTRQFPSRQNDNESWRGSGDDANRYSSDGDRFFGGQAGPNSWSSGRPYGGGERGATEGGRGFWDKASDEVSSWFGDRDAERRRDADQHRGRGPKGYARSDERIRDDVNDRLTDDGWVDASDIEVSVKDREVTLAGTVADRNAKRRAEDIAEGVSGVAHVQNNIRVKAKDGTGSTDVDIDRTGATAQIAKTGAGGMR